MRTAETSLKENSVESRGDERIQVLKQVCAKTEPRFHRLATNYTELKLKFSGGGSGHAAGWGVSPPGLPRPWPSVLVDHFTTIALEPTLPKETKRQQNPRQCQFISRHRTVILVAFSWDYGTEQGPHPSSGTTKQISFVHLMCRLYQL